MLRLLKFRCSFCSSPLDETQARAGALAFERDAATGLYRISSGGMLLTESGRSTVLASADGSASQLWRVAPSGAGYSVASASGLAHDDGYGEACEDNVV